MKGWGRRKGGFVAKGGGHAKGSGHTKGSGHAKGGAKGGGHAKSSGHAKGGGHATGGTKTSTKGATAQPTEERLRVKCGRVVGKVVRWRGEEGWIRPETNIDHPFKLKNSGEIFISQKDVAAGQQLRPGVMVDFLVYSIKEGGGRLGADFCRLAPNAPKAAPGAPPAAKAGAPVPSPLAKVRGSVGTSSKMLAATAAKLKSVAKAKAKGSEGPRQVIMKPAAKTLPVKKNQLKPVKSTGSSPEMPKGKGKGGKGKEGKGKGEEKERTMVARIPRLGTIVKWLGKYGWIEADKAVDHEYAARNQGRIFLHVKDFDGEAPKAGTRVTFQVYADASGLGATYCKPTQPPPASSSAAAGSAGAAGAKVIVPKARPMKPRDGPTEPSLPPFWEKHWSEQHQMPYFWNSKTKESRWTKPTK